jgi:hypothetical protein
VQKRVFTVSGSRLRDSYVRVEVATVDRRLRKALKEADVTVHVKPWNASIL